MSTKIASLYADIGAKTDGLDKGLQQTKSKLTSAKAGLKNIAAAAAITTTAIIATVKAFEKVYAVAREGAELDYTRDKFDRLSESIGTTSDALLYQLRDATRGMYSDFELMANVTDLVGLGLAKNSDEAVRLSRVAAGLNMNMSQLVLTLTNQTTMRFDTLGVSVDGFDDKLKELEAQGYSTNDAFKEAFLQQAEKQLDTVGEAADSTLGSYMRLEAGWKSYADTVKASSSKTFEPIVKYLGDEFDEFNKTTEAMKHHGDQIKKLARETTAGGRWGAEYNNNLREIALSFYDADQAAYKYTGTVGGVTTETMLSADAIKEMTKTNEEYLDAIGTITRENEDHADRLSDLKIAELEAKNELDKLVKTRWWDVEAIEAQKHKIADLQAAQWQEVDDFEENKNRRILAMAEEQLAIDGLSEEEKQALEDRGIERGLYTQDAVDQWREERDEVARITGEITASINDIPEQKDVDVTVTTTYTSRTVSSHASGAGMQEGPGYSQGTEGWMTIPPGYPNDTYPMMVSSGEHVNVVPKGGANNSTPAMNSRGGQGIGSFDYDRLATALVRALQRVGVGV